MGLCPAQVKGTKETDYADTSKAARGIHLLARQPIEMERAHPFTAAGDTEFNCLLWMPPGGRRAGGRVLVDSTHFTTLFGVTESLKNFGRNIALMK